MSISFLKLNSNKLIYIYIILNKSSYVKRKFNKLFYFYYLDKY